MSRRSAFLLLCGLVPAVAACSGSEDPADGGSSDTVASASSGSSGGDVGDVPAGTSSGATALPGDEALAPLAPDDSASAHLSALAGLPSGALEGRLELTLSGLTAFAEPVQGTCRQDDGTSTFRATLSDGSALAVRFGADGGRSDLTAPGIEVHSVFDGPEVSAEGAAFTVESPLVTDGTSENSGTLRLVGTCG